MPSDCSPAQVGVRGIVCRRYTTIEAIIASCVKSECSVFTRRFGGMMFLRAGCTIPKFDMLVSPGCRHHQIVPTGNCYQVFYCDEDVWTVWTIPIGSFFFSYIGVPPPRPSPWLAKRDLLCVLTWNYLGIHIRSPNGPLSE